MKKMPREICENNMNINTCMAREQCKVLQRWPDNFEKILNLINQQDLYKRKDYEYEYTNEERESERKKEREIWLNKRGSYYSNNTGKNSQAPGKIECYTNLLNVG